MNNDGGSVHAMKNFGHLQHVNRRVTFVHLRELSAALFVLFVRSQLNTTAQICVSMRDKEITAAIQNCG